MEIKELQEAHHVTLRPVGDLDANSSIVLDEKIKSLIEQKRINIHLDFSEVAYISSAGWGVFTFYYDDISSMGGKIVMSGMNENVHDVFDVLGLYQLFEVIRDKDDREVSAFFSQ